MSRCATSFGELRSLSSRSHAGLPPTTRSSCVTRSSCAPAALLNSGWLGDSLFPHREQVGIPLAVDPVAEIGVELALTGPADLDPLARRGAALPECHLADELPRELALSLRRPVRIGEQSRVRDDDLFLVAVRLDLVKRRLHRLEPLSRLGGHGRMPLRPERAPESQVGQLV